MSIVRVQKRERYKAISNVPLNDARLTLEARGLLVHLLAQADGWSVNVNALTKRARKSSAGRIYNLFKELMEYGYCRRIDYKDVRGRAAGNEYQIFEEPADDGLPPVIVLPDTVKPNVVKPNSVLPDQENPHHNKYEVLTNTKLNKNEVNSSSIQIASDDWPTPDRIMQDLEHFGVRSDFVELCLIEFRAFWKGKIKLTAGEWDSRFLQRCREQWDRVQRRAVS